jgi:hypothetical protein
LPWRWLPSTGRCLSKGGPARRPYQAIIKDKYSMSQCTRINEKHFFKLTKIAIESYKKDNPLEGARNPRIGYLKTQWDINYSITQWFLTLLIICCSLITDIIALPFQIISRVIKIITNNK